MDFGDPEMDFGDPALLNPFPEIFAPRFFNQVSVAGLFKIVGPTIFGSVQCHPAVLRAGERGSVREAQGVDVTSYHIITIAYLYSTRKATWGVLARARAGSYDRHDQHGACLIPPFLSLESAQIFQSVRI